MQVTRYIIALLIALFPVVAAYYYHSGMTTGFKQGVAKCKADQAIIDAKVAKQTIDYSNANLMATINFSNDVEKSAAQINAASRASIAKTVKHSKDDNLVVPPLVRAEYNQHMKSINVNQHTNKYLEAMK